MLTQEWLIRETQQAERITLRLSDGTVVKLNSQSRISVPQPFGDQREVHLVGEAYFQVASDSLRPFRVYTGEIVTEVLGTSFNLLYFPHRKRMEVAVETGKVRVKGNFPEGVYDLVPSEKLLCTPESVRKSHFSYDRVFGWKDGLLCFEEADFDEIAFRLARWYGCKVVYDSRAMNGRKFSGKFKNQTLDEILKGISYASDFTYRIDNHKVFIQPKNEKLPMQ
jgi:ferric-dicitrate binding protein FerR (iron transport regulator)